MSKDFDTGVSYAKRGCPDRMNAAEVKAAQESPDEFWAGVESVTDNLAQTRDECLITRAAPTRGWRQL